MQPITVTIEDGAVRFLLNEDTAPLVEDGAITRRASHVEPDGAVLRAVFHGLRFVFGDHGRVAELTRLLPCVWRVNLAPSNGPVLPGRWTDRRQAIEAEIVWLNENFI